MRSSQTERSAYKGVVYRLILVVMVAIVLIPPSSLGAVDKAPAHRVLLDYERQYTIKTTDEQRFHRGVDIKYCVDEAVSSPVSGMVSFAGKIPTESGSRVQAITVTTASGHQVTLQPLTAIEAKRGQTIALGQRLGTIASSGDLSTDEPHVHLSLRVNKVYNNPSHLIKNLSACALVASDDSGAGDVPVRTESSGAGDAFARGNVVLNGQANGVQRGSVSPSSMQPLSEQRQTTDGRHSSVHANNLTDARSLKSIDADIFRNGSLHYSRVKMSDERLVGSIMSSRLSKVSPVAQGNPSTIHGPLLYLSDLSQAELFAALFLAGIALPCAGIGVYTMCGRMGISISSIHRIVAARDE